MTDNKEAMRSALAGIIKTVPASINSASVQAVREWKKSIVKAQKAVDSSRASYEQLQNLYTQLSQYR